MSAEGFEEARTKASPPVVALDGLSKHYGAVQAVDDVSMQAHSREILAIVGENGAGKSTLMRMLAGIEAPDAGEIRIDGEPVILDTSATAVAHGISFVPQEMTLCTDMTVAENTTMGDHLSISWGRYDRKLARERARDRLTTLGLRNLPVSVHVSSLSLVERAFVQIARALRPETRILIMDEPTAPMSNDDADRLLAVLRTIAERGVAVLYISHRLEEVLRLADRAIVLRDGALVAEFRGEQITTSALVTSMVGAELASVDLDRGQPAFVDGGLDVGALVAPGLDGVDLRVRRGEVVGVYGVLGSGREVLGRVLVEAAADAGRILVDGADVTGGGIPATIAAGVGYIPPERREQGLVLEQSVTDNITLAMLDGMSRRGVLRRDKIEELANRWIAALDIRTPSSSTAVADLSGGSQQKVLLARWLAAEAGVLVLEEPTRGVDVRTKAEIHEILRERAAAGAAVLVITSDLDEVVQVCDRVVVMRHGRVAAEVAGGRRHDVAVAALEGAA